MAAVQAPPLTTGRKLVIFLAGNISIPFFVPFQEQNADLSQHAMILVAWISAVFLNAALLWGVLRREHGDRRLMRKTVLLALFLCIASGIASTVAVTLTTTQNSYLALAQSDKLLNEIHPERKRLVVEFIRQSAANSAENNRNAAALKPIDPPLYTVASFANKSAIETTAAQLKAAYALDVDYQTKVAQATRDFRGKMASADAEYLRSWDASRRDEENEAAAISSAEKEWVSNTLGLYDFAERHAMEIIVRNGALEYTSQAVRNEFVRRVDECKAFQQAMASARDKALVRQKASRQQMGLRPNP